MNHMLQEIDVHKVVRGVVKLLVCILIILSVWQRSLSEHWDRSGFLWILLLAFALCVSVCRFGILYLTWKKSEKMRGIWYAVYFTVSWMLYFYPMNEDELTVTAYKRVMGAGIIADYDVSKLIQHFTAWFCCFMMTFALFFLLLHHFAVRKKTQEQYKVCKYLDKIVVLANIDLVFRCITYFYDENALEQKVYASTGLFQLIMAAGLFYVCMSLDKSISAVCYLQILICICMSGYPVSVLFFRGKNLIKVQAVMLCLLLSFIKCSRGLFQKRNMQRFLESGVMIFCLFPFMTSFYIEFINVLNQYGIFVAYPRKYYIFIVLLLAGLFLLSFFILKKKGWSLQCWKRWSYPWIVFGIACLSVQIPLESAYGADIFETANSSVLISDFLNFGSIPIVEHYGGHMMTNVWEGLLYAVINQDFKGAVFSPYAGYCLPLLTLLFFCFVTYTMDRDIALWAALLFPFYGNWSYFGYGMLSCLAVTAFIRKQTYIRAFLIWGVLAWCALYRLDLGFAFGIASIAALTIYLLVNQNRNAVKQMILSCIFMVVIGGIIWCALCICKGCNPWIRLLEFLQISQSNTNWAYHGIGNSENFVFAWSYLLVPFTVCAALLYMTVSKKFRNNVGNEKWILLLIFGISYLANFSRGLVRHSIAEMNMTVVIWSAYIFLATFFSCLKGRQDLFFGVFTLFILCNTLFCQDQNFTEVSVLDHAVNKTGSLVEQWTDKSSIDNESDEKGLEKTYWEHLSDKAEVVNRVQWQETLKKQIAPYRLLFDHLLEQDETYVDFTNQSFLYSVLGKKSPVYVSQSPGQLSGEYTQEQFIEQIRNHIAEIPLALMPLAGSSYLVQMDGIANAYRYYKVSEFIYTHYRPLCGYGETAVWCAKERYEEFKQKLVSAGQDVTEQFISCKSLSLNNCLLKQNLDEKSIIVSGAGTDPIVDGLEMFIDLELYDGLDIKMVLEYESDSSGTNDLRVYYTTKRQEAYTEEKSVDVHMISNGLAEFIIPVTKDSRLRLDIPEQGTVTIHSMRVEPAFSLIDWGYDEAAWQEDEAGNGRFIYNGTLHHYDLGQLPRIWAEHDEARAVKNKMISRLKRKDSVYCTQDSVEKSEKGNYLLLSAVYKEGTYNINEENSYTEADVVLGNYKNGKFYEKYRYVMELKEDYHTYLIRISSDYYWYSEPVQAVKVECMGNVDIVEMKILEGD